jgi:aminoglycoside phosphotransferase (APT) family kinase protein
MDGSAEVHGGGNRLRWEDAPAELRARIEGLARRRVIAAESSVGGFSPGLASTLVLEDGRRIFAKAASHTTSDVGLELYRRERDVLTRLPDPVPRAHLLVAQESSGWIVLLYEHIPGRHPVPSNPADLAAMVAAFETLSTVLDPAPLPLAPFEEAWGRRFDSWDRAPQDAPTALELDPWIAAHVQDVTEATRGWRGAVHGDALVHGDLRADNMLLRPDGSIVVLDWPESSRGAPWLDIALALPSMAMFRNAPPIRELADNRILRAVERTQLAAVVGGLSGFFLCASVQPAIPALPTLRSFQRRQGLQAAAWLRSLL